MSYNAARRIRRRSRPHLKGYLRGTPMWRLRGRRKSARQTANTQVHAVSPYRASGLMDRFPWLRGPQ